MHVPLAILSVLVVIGTMGIFLYDLKTKKYEVFSMRNMVLLGFAHFFGIGTYFTATTGFGTDLYVASERGIQMLFFATLLFLIVFFIAQRIGFKWRWMRRLVPCPELPCTQAGVHITIVALLAGGFLGAVLPNFGYLSALYSQFRGGMATAAMALATYNLLARRFNPMAWGVFVGTFGAAVLISTTGDIGRRAMLGVMLAICWIWYYYSLRYRPVGSTILKVGVVMSFAFVALVIYAGFRGHGAGAGVGRGGFSIETRINQFAEAITNPTIRSTDVQSSIMSDAPTNSMFIMENYGEAYDYDPFNGIKYIISNPIPRFLWPDKPVGMGITVQKQLRSPANLGVGIIGHGWAEGAWIGIAGYALFFGLVAAALDNLILQRLHNPYFIAAIGSSLGNVYAIARGETSLMVLQVFNYYVGVIVVYYLLNIFFKPIMAASAPLVPAIYTELAQNDADDEYADYDADEQAWSDYPAPGAPAPTRTYA